MNIKEMIENARKIAAAHGVTLKVDDNVIVDEKHLDCVWYGGTIAELRFGGRTLEVVVNGEVDIIGEHNGSEFRYRNKSGSGALSPMASDSLRTAFASDEELYMALDKGEIEFIDGSWIECFVYNENNVEIYNFVADVQTVLEVFEEDNINDLINTMNEECDK